MDRTYHQLPLVITCVNGTGSVHVPSEHETEWLWEANYGIRQQCSVCSEGPIEPLKITPHLEGCEIHWMGGSEYHDKNILINLLRAS